MHTKNERSGGVAEAFINFFHHFYPIFFFLMPHLLGDGWTYWNIAVSAVITQR